MKKIINKSNVNKKINWDSEDIINFDPMAREPDKNKNNKISINKSELIKAVNVEAKSGESGYLLSPISYDSKVKDEDKTVKELQEWIDNQRDLIESELKSIYKGSF